MTDLLPLLLGAGLLAAPAHAQPLGAGGGGPVFASSEEDEPDKELDSETERPVEGATNRALGEAANDPSLKEALSALYDLDYEKTQTLAFRFIRSHPENPFGHLFAAGALWWEVSAEAGSVQHPKALSERFDELVEGTLKKAKVLMKSKDARERPDGYFAAGMVLGLRGQWKLAGGEWMSAYRDGKKAIKYLRKCVKLDPGYADAYMGLGIFDYQTAKLPAILRMGAKILFRGVGDSRRGLERIRLAVDKGRFSNQQAMSFLLTLMVLYEKDYPQGLELSRQLRRDFPDSPYYAFAESVLLGAMGDQAGSYQTALDLFAKGGRTPESLWMKQKGIVCGLAGALCLEPQHVEAAARWLDVAISSATAVSERASPRSRQRGIKAAPEAPLPPRWFTLLHFYRGLAHDLLTERRAAVEEYDTVLELADLGHAQAWARYCREVPCDRAQADAILGGQPAPALPIKR